MHKANLDPKEVVALYKQGCFVSNIAAMLHTSKPRVKKILADEGMGVFINSAYAKKHCLSAMVSPWR